MQVRFLIIFVFSLLTHILSAQTVELLVQGTTPNLYLVHTIAPKENWYSLGRLYNANPKEIAPYNGMSIDKTLKIGQQVNVPLNAVNFAQNGMKTADEVFIPVYHIIQDKEWMYRVSVNYHKVPVETLEYWNGITNDQVKAGMKLIIGYLKVKKDQSALASQVPPAGISPAGIKVQTQPTQVVVKEEEKKPELMEKKTDPPIVNQETKDIKPLDEKKTVEEKSSPIITRPLNTSTVSNANEGYFRSIYEPTGKSASGFAGIFKSTSGWQDTKYYALMNNVAVGTIIRVTNPSSGKMIYAKVLGDLPDMKESIGLTIRVSDAGTSELGVLEGKFNVSISY